MRNETEGRKRMHFYEIHNWVTKEMRRGWAKSPQEACEMVGWLIGDCFVMVLASHLIEERDDKT